MIEERDVNFVFRRTEADDGYWEYPKMATKCPVCHFEYQHFCTPFVVDSQDNYKAGWGGRGDLLVVPFVSECGSKWALCFGFHKGHSAAFVKILRTCKGQIDETNYEFSQEEFVELLRN